MKPHQFLNLLEDKTRLPDVRSCPIHKYPADFVDRYNSQVQKIMSLAEEVSKELERMTELEVEQMRLVTKEY